MVKGRSVDEPFPEYYMPAHQKPKWLVWFRVPFAGLISEEFETYEEAKAFMDDLTCDKIGENHE